MREYNTLQRPEGTLDYNHVHVHFIYSFATDLATCRGTSLDDELKAKQWTNLPLHQRPTVSDMAGDSGQYQPSLVSRDLRVFQKGGVVVRNGVLLVPLEPYSVAKLGACSEIPIDLYYALRLYEGGGGVVNFTLCLKDEAARFSNIHAAIRFCQSVDAHTEGSRKHLVHTFLSTSQGDFPEAELIPVGLQHVSVHELFSNLLRNRADWLPSNFTQAWLDPSVFPTEDPGQNWQAPYIFTVAEVNQESFELVGRNGIGTAKELGSVLCKMVLDNRVVSDYLNLGDDYLRKVVGLSGNDGPISNLSLDARLFFALSRRGALAVTTRTDEMPGYFVLPSFLNLVEILRSRWHMGNVVNISLDAAIRRVATSMDNNPSQLLDQMFVLRSAFANFMRDPVPYLFDGGSVTELAEQAQREFWLLDLRQVIAEKLDMLDKLVQDVVERRRIQELMR